MMAVERLRQTGRTSRMLDEARRLAKDGHAVYVVAADEQHAQSLRGAHPNCRVLVDHYAIERLYGPVLGMLHRFDA